MHKGIITRAAVLPLDPKDIDLIIALSREFSLTATGQRLGITTAAVSQRLSKIEEKLGITLSSRAGHLIFTTAGHQVLNYCLQAKQDAAELERGLQRLKEPRVHVMADATLLLNDFPLAVERLTLDMPTAKIFLKSGSFSDIIRHVLTGSADIGIIAGDPGVDGLRLLKYRKERVCLLMSDSHPLSQFKEVSAAEALRYPLIQVSTLEHIAPILAAMAEELKITVRNQITVDSFQLQARIAATTDAGLAFTLETEAKQYLNTHSVSMVQLIDDWADNQLYFCTRAAGSMSDAATKLMGMIAALASQRKKPQ